MAIEFYKEFGELGYLANYSNHGFYKDKIYYKTAEHYYQASKFDDNEVRNRIINADTPKEASNIGRDRNNIRRDGFNKIKNDVMYEAIYYKFSQNPDIRSKLIRTGNEEIKEMTVKESYWGVGPNLDGTNYSGKILMEVRERLKEELLDKIINNCKNKKVYILGEKEPSQDSINSCLLLSRILNSFGINAIYDISMDSNSNYYILVNHNNLDGIDKEKVLGCFDIHDITFDIDDLIDIGYESCSILIYELFKDRYNFTDEDKKMIY